MAASNSGWWRRELGALWTAAKSAGLALLPRRSFSDLLLVGSSDARGGGPGGGAGSRGNHKALCCPGVIRGAVDTGSLPSAPAEAAVISAPCCAGQGCSAARGLADGSSLMKKDNRDVGVCGNSVSCL